MKTIKTFLFKEPRLPMAYSVMLLAVRLSAKQACIDKLHLLPTCQQEYFHPLALIH